MQPLYILRCYTSDFLSLSLKNKEGAGLCTGTGYGVYFPERKCEQWVDSPHKVSVVLVLVAISRSEEVEVHTVEVLRLEARSRS